MISPIYWGQIMEQAEQQRPRYRAMIENVIAENPRKTGTELFLAIGAACPALNRYERCVWISEVQQATEREKAEA